MKIRGDDILFRRVKSAHPEHWADGKPLAPAFGLASARPRRLDASGQPIAGKAGKYERGYSVNVARLSSVTETLGSAPHDYTVVGFKANELIAAGFELEADPVDERHPAYARTLVINLAHALVIRVGAFALYRQEGKDRLSALCYVVDQTTGDLEDKYFGE